VSAKLVAAGDNDFALCSGDSALLGRTQGLPIVVVAVLYPRTPASIYSLKQKNIVKPTDLYGKRYGATYKSTTYQQFIAFTNAAGLDRSRIQIVPSPGKAEELMAGTIDAQGGYTYLQPVQLEVAGQSINEILLADYGVQIYSMSIIANDQTLAKRRALAAAFVKATLQGFQQMIADPPAAFSSFLKYNRGANKAVEEAKLRKLATFLARDQPPKLGWQTEDGWRKTQETLLLLKIIEKGIDVRRVFTTDLLP
jgi:ABC-type nitrate/sulfonate/bicarbonate transport system substrate-binding protein